MLSFSLRTVRLWHVSSAPRIDPAPVRARVSQPAPAARVVPPLLPIWLPLIVAAIASGAIFAWIFPPAASDAAAPAVRFTEVTSGAGVNFVRRNGADPAMSPTTLGGGVVVFDFDADGDDDLFFVNGTAWPWEETFAKHAGRGGCVLYRNDGEGRFSDVSAAAEVNIEFQGMAAAAGDFDNDGLPDLFVTGVGANHLFHNRGNGRFENITEEAGVGGEANTWSTGAVWLDYDGDGRLDLIVGHYARWPEEVGLSGAFAVALMGHSYGAPTGFIGVAPSVYRNLGDGRFALVPGSAGLRPLDPATGLPAAKLLALIPVDANGDGRLDLWCTFHTLPPALFLNDGAGAFRAWTPPMDDRQEGASAGVAAAGSLPLLPAGGVDQRFATLLSAMQIAPAFDDAPVVHLASRLGIALLDYDRDGRMDVFSGEGRAEPDANRFEAGRDFAASPQVWWNRGDGWTTTTAEAGDSGAWAEPLVARGVAVVDFDGDGNLDVVITQADGAPRLLRNERRSELPWLAIDLIATRTAREAGGARVEVHTPRRVHVETAAPAMGFMAQSTSTLHFGLGDDARVRRIVVNWPSGHRQEERGIELNRRMTITER